MTPKEKAKELIDKFTSVNGNSFFAKECAIVVADEIIKDYKKSLKVSQGVNFANGLIAGSMLFWQSVKTELEKFK